MPIELTSAARTSAAPGARRKTFRLRASRIGARDRMFLLEQLSLLLETGVTLHAALQSLKKESTNPALDPVLDALIADIAAGRSFSMALERHPNVFSATHVNLVAASENGGFLPGVMTQLLQMEERQEKLRSTVLAAAAYPAFLSLFSIGVVVFVLVIVFPQFGEIFTNIEDDLPITTKILMWCSEFVRDYWLQCIAVGAFAAAAAYRWATSDAGGEIVDRLKIGAPVIGAIFVKLYLVQSMRAMSLSLGNGVSAVETLAACHEVVVNRVFRGFLAQVRASVEEGGTLAAGFSKADFIPATVRQLVATGEESGNLAKVLGRVADFYERDLEKQLALVARLAEPVLLLVMGAVVGLIVSSLILPIFMLSRAIG